jgi:thiamine biosynthesis lipoprotein
VVNRAVPRGCSPRSFALRARILASALAVLALVSCSDGPRAGTGVPGAPAASTTASAAGTATEAHLVSREHVSMGAPVQLSAYTTREADAVAAFGAAFAEFDRLDSLLSVWKEGSDVLHMNAAAGDRPVSVSSDTLDVLRQAIQAGDWTNGKFDITFGALADVWKFDHDQDNHVPTPSEIAARLPLVDYRNVVIDEKARTAFIRKRGARVHLGGIGKGFAVDHAVSILRSRGLTDFMVQSGGDMYVAGRRGDRPWRLGIRDPRGPADRTFATLELSDSTFSTSGDYERFFMQNGVRYHHLIDPDLGRPVQGTRSVTIVAKSATQADWLSTGVFVSGPELGMALIEKLPDVEGVIVTDRNEVLVSSGLRGRLDILAPPTDAP